ncbi:MAG: HlyD family type I secretion periplasmic adaptor subunit [Thiovulaceae bacterium]|nr:HlyD family type I secretion periplasmic adaptor subunit [Sulfurimonadaceae bacterium]
MKNDVINVKDTNLPDTNDKKYIYIGLSIIFVVFIMLGIWSAFAKLDSGVPCSGQVAVESSNKVIQHLEGGIVKEVYVHDGSIVKKGDDLIRFSDVKSESDLNSILANYYETVALRDRYLSESRNESSIHFSSELDALDALQSGAIKKRQMDTFTNETGYLAKQKIVATQQIDSLTKQIQSLTESVENKKALLRSYKEEAKEQSELLKDGLVDKLKLVDANRRINMTESDLLSLQAEISKDRAQKNSINTQYLLDREKFFTELNSNLSKSQTSIEDMKARMDNYKDNLARTILKSPIDGVVMNLAVHTIGAVVPPGNPIMDVVPTDAKLIVEGKVSPEYIDFVKVGHKAAMTFPSFQMKGNMIEKIEGQVIFVAADSVTDKEGHSSYSIKLLVTKNGEKTLKDNGFVLLAGMPASITVKAGSQTTLEYLLKPMSLMLDRAFLEQ